MMIEPSLFEVIQGYLPTGAVIAALHNGYENRGIQMGNMTRNGQKEIAVGYIWQGEPYVMVLKNYNFTWYRVFDIKGTGYNISFLRFVDITGDGREELVVGWQHGAIWSELNIFESDPRGLKKMVSDIYCSRMELIKVPKEKRTALALWNHVTGEAYKIEVLQWGGQKLIPAFVLYPIYFAKVVTYYLGKVKEMPEAAFYWYYLADAQIKAKMYQDALESIERGLGLQAEYPSKEEFLELRSQIPIRNQEHEIYPASVSEVGGTKWGYINQKAEFVIDPVYDRADDFGRNGLAVVIKNDMAGMINRENHFVIPPEYQSINEFSEQRVVAWGDQKAYLLDENGTVLYEVTGYLSNMKEGRAAFGTTDPKEQWKYGYIDHAGNVVIKPQFLSAGDFHEGKAVVQLADQKSALIDKKGKVVQVFPYVYVGIFHDGIAPFRETFEADMGYINEQGAVVIPPTFDGAQEFQEERAIVNLLENYTPKYGLIDKLGRYVIGPKYNDIRMLGEQRVAVGIPIDPENPFIGSKYGVANTDGKLLTEFIYFRVNDYEKGLASVEDGKETFFIDRTGKREEGLPSVKGSGTLYLKNGVIQARIGSRISYLDRKGNVIWKQMNDVVLNEQYMVKEEQYTPNRNYLVYYPRIMGMTDKQAEKEANEKLQSLAGAEGISGDEELDYSYQGDFIVTFFRNHLVQIRITGYNYPFGAAHGMPTLLYAHLDLHSGRFYELKDLFKNDADYVKELSDIIRKQIVDQGEDAYIWLDQYKGIDANQPFFITEEALHIYFLPYEIAPYAAGFPTFTIPFAEIEGIINKEGDFWRAFH